METRQKTEYKVYVLCLADVRGGVDSAHAVAVFDELEDLKNYYNSQLADEPYTDEPSPDYYGNVHSYHKVFKRGSPLEWYNPADSLEPVYNTSFGGVLEDWIEYHEFTVPYNPSTTA